tara:strand:+ start:670 stop:1101 length:432 start_codon:yes stop_codon:yes gene_type:complete
MANKVNREDREKSPEFDSIDLMKPVDVTVFGTEDDPCFGKHYDLSTDECQRCGDHEFCAIAMGHKLNTQRKQIEKDNDFLDVIEEVEVETKAPLSIVRMKKLVNIRLKKDYSFIKTYKTIKAKYPTVDKSSLKSIYKELKSKG